MVEAEPVAAAVRRAVPGLKARIDVVPNCVNATLLRPPDAALPPVVASRGPRLLYVARAYPHKNHDFLGLVGEELDRRGLPVKFVVTLNPEEWAARTAAFRLHADNVGPLGVDQLAGEYRKADAAVFPSLLESFSVTPLEGLAFGKVVLASDRDFVQATCGDAVLYFDPLDPVDCADRIEDWWTHRAEVEETQARETARLLAELPGPADRARAYVRLIDQELRHCLRARIQVQ